MKAPSTLCTGLLFFRCNVYLPGRFRFNQKRHLQLTDPCAASRSH